MYRLLYPPVRIDDKERPKRPAQGDSAQRVYQLPIAPRTGRAGGRR